MTSNNIQDLKDYVQHTSLQLSTVLEVTRLLTDVNYHSSLLLATEVLQMMSYIARIDRDLSLDEVKLFKEIVDCIDPNFRDEVFSGASSPEQLKLLILKIEPEKDWAGPHLLSVLSNYDNVYGTVYADEARAMFFRIANAVVKADGKVTPQEQKGLQNLREMLYLVDESDTNAGVAIEESSGEAKPRALEDLLEELDSLVGLSSVKNDVKELVNFLKVQQLRQSKGMTTMPVSRHLVFFGNPGTGKTTVARLLAEIYGSLGRKKTRRSGKD